MSKFCVLHLSDLHIGKVDASLDKLRDYIIQDIQKLLEKNSLVLDAIAITGDLVDRGGTENSFHNANEFLENLTTSVGLEINQLIIVPGNHDIIRSKPSEIILDSIVYDELNDETLFNDYWTVLSSRFHNYNRFFNKTTAIEGEFGSSVMDIDTDRGILSFISLNSAWSSSGANDYSNLLIGRKQLESLARLTADLPSADLTLALTHHPIDWFDSRENQMLTSFLRNKDLMPVDAILHGHTHDSQIEIKVDPDGSLLFLKTGIGYPNSTKRDKGFPKLSGCRYSLYLFDMETSCLDIWLRISRDTGSFAADTLLYEAGSENGHINIPFRHKKTDIVQILNKKNFLDIQVDTVPVNPDWVGRKNEIQELLNSSYRVVAITGLGGQGKSALAAEFLRRNTREKGAAFEIGVFVDCRELPHSIHVKLIELLEAISEGNESSVAYRDERIEDTTKRLLQHIQNRKTVIVFDNIDAYIKADTESVIPELKPLLDTVLNNEHNSLIIFTCRPPFNDSRGAFFHLQLKGFDEQDCIDYFVKRKINLRDNNSEKYCRKLACLTNGHPLWLGLIAGQIITHKENIKEMVEKFSRGESVGSEALRDYFNDIWDKQLRKDDQHVLRYLVEAPRPLTDIEIIQAVREAANKTKGILQRLCRLGLLERHEGTKDKTNVYQVHPLVREYVHESFTPASQKQYVYRVLYLFLPQSTAKNLFSNSSKIETVRDKNISPDNVFQSIETCLNSRHYTQALKLLERFQYLFDEGFHHKMISITSRVLDSINWKKEGVVNRSSGINLLNQFIWQLSVFGDTIHCKQYLMQYETNVETFTIMHAIYLSLESYIAWQQGDYPYALEVADQYDEICSKLINNPNCKFPVSYTRALVLRDMGQYKNAIPLFQGSSGTGARLGNCARCLVRLKDYSGAETLLRYSIQYLKKDDDYISNTNLGYAYLWLSEAFFFQKKYKETAAVLLLSKAKWEEYAPGLITMVDDMIINTFGNMTLPIIDYGQAYQIIEQFLQEDGEEVEEILRVYLQ